METPITHSIPSCLAHRFNSAFEVAEVVTIPLRRGECRETRGDDLRRWCGANCAARWKQMRRGASDAVRIEFECLTDAVMFRLAA